MARFLLIHGSCHGAWCWDAVIAALQARGHEAVAIDLPAHGQDRTPAAAATLEGYARAVLGALDAPAVVVGHSMGGYPITAAAEIDPSRIQALVYLCAYVPKSGMSLAEMRRAGPRQPLAGKIVTAPDRVSFTFDPAVVEETFYHDCPPDRIARAARLLCPEPVAPQETALEVTARSTGLRRYYVRCSEDRVIPPEYQSTMAAGFVPGTVSSMEASHSPFFAMPGGLADRLGTIARGV